MEIKIKVGKVTFSSPASGAFIQPLESPESKMMQMAPVQSQVFVTPEFLKKLPKPLEVGQLVRYEVSEDESVASNIEPMG